MNVVQVFLLLEAHLKDVKIYLQQFFMDLLNYNLFVSIRVHRISILNIAVLVLKPVFRVILA